MNTIETLAAALYSACLRDLPDIEWVEQDHWQERVHLDSLSHDQRQVYYTQRKGILSDDERRAFFAARGIPVTQRRRRPAPEDCDTYLFPQVWGSTALGYGGIGGQAVTRAHTAVVRCNYSGYAAVYFASGRLAYLVSSTQQGDAWNTALREHSMPPCNAVAEAFGVLDPGAATERARRS